MYESPIRLYSQFTGFTMEDNVVLAIKKIENK